MIVVPTITYDDFARVEILAGTVVAAEPFTQARVPAIKLTIDFGPGVGTRRSSAQITAEYAPETVIGKQVAAVVNFAPKRIAGFSSEVLVLGFTDGDGRVVLVSPDRRVADGLRLA